VATEQALTDDEFALFRNLIYGEAGIILRPERRAFLASRVRHRLQALGLRSPYQYYRLLSDGPERNGELLHFLDLLTINETSFFRNAPQFDLLGARVLPEILERKARAANPVLRIWSAGCSTGQEPYSLAMAVLEHGPQARGIAPKIFASDISLTALEFAQQGFYPETKANGIPPAYLARHFERLNGGYAVKDGLKRLIVFDYHNLKHDHGLSMLDIIFCRNVMIYFDEPEQRRLVEKFHAALVPGGYLFLGHAESLQGVSTAFRFLYVNKGIAYQKAA
jgi:chemotaxis protein methyltransferase CheR